MYTTTVKVEKGEEVGRFNFGSTIVLFFEAEKGFYWEVKEGSKVRFGDKLGKFL